MMRLFKKNLLCTLFPGLQMSLVSNDILLILQITFLIRLPSNAIPPRCSKCLGGGAVAEVSAVQMGLPGPTCTHATWFGLEEFRWVQVTVTATATKSNPSPIWPPAMFHSPHIFLFYSHLCPCSTAPETVHCWRAISPSSTVVFKLRKSCQDICDVWESFNANHDPLKILFSAWQLISYCVKIYSNWGILEFLLLSKTY